MGKLKIKYKNKWYEYLINTEVEDHVNMQAIEHILKYFPKDAPVEFEELF
jgi:hypothetical protein